MAITIYGRGYPLCAEVLNDGCIRFGLNEGTAMAITSAGLISAATISAGSIQSTTLCGTATPTSAINLAGLTFTGGSSACLSGGLGTISADHFLKVTMGVKTYYIPAYASAGALSAI